MVATGKFQVVCWCQESGVVRQSAAASLMQSNTSGHVVCWVGSQADTSNGAQLTVMMFVQKGFVLVGRVETAASVKPARSSCLQRVLMV